MAITKNKESRRKANIEYQKRHPEKHRQHSRTYREKHKAEIAEYNRMNPEIRLRLTRETYDALQRHLGPYVAGTVRMLIADYLAKRSENA